MLGRHLLRQDIVAGTDVTPGCFKQNSFNLHIKLDKCTNSCFVVELKKENNRILIYMHFIINQ